MIVIRGLDPDDLGYFGYDPSSFDISPSNVAYLDVKYCTLFAFCHRIRDVFIKSHVDTDPYTFKP